MYAIRSYYGKFAVEGDATLSLADLAPLGEWLEVPHALLELLEEPLPAHLV